MTHGIPRSRPRWAISEESPTSGVSGSRKETLRWTGPHSACQRTSEQVTSCSREGTTHRRAVEGADGLNEFGRGHIRGPAHGRTEDPGLHRRLVRTCPPQLRRTVRRQDHERHARVVSLEHGRVQVRHSSPRRRDHDHRCARTLCEPQSQEPGGPLVDPHVQAKATFALGLLDGIRKGRGARTGSEDDLANATTDQLVDKDTSERGGRVHQLPDAGGPTNNATPVRPATATTPTTAARAGLWVSHARTFSGSDTGASPPAAKRHGPSS